MNKKRLSKRGSALPTILSILIVGSIMVYTSMQLFSAMNKAQARLKDTMAVEDLRNYIRQVLNCGQTVISNTTTPGPIDPDGIQEIRLLDASGNEFLNTAGTSFGRYTMRARATVAEPTLYRIEISRTTGYGTGSWKGLFREPLGCAP